MKNKAAMTLNRKLLQVKSALIAKETFIEEHYDYCKHPKSLDLDLFNKIKTQNTTVNVAVSEFINKLATSQADIKKIESEKAARKALGQ